MKKSLIPSPHAAWRYPPFLHVLPEGRAPALFVTKRNTLAEGAMPQVPLFLRFPQPSFPPPPVRTPCTSHPGTRLLNARSWSLQAVFLSPPLQLPFFQKTAFPSVHGLSSTTGMEKVPHRVHALSTFLILFCYASFGQAPFQFFELRERPLKVTEDFLISSAARPLDVVSMPFSGFFRKGMKALFCSF